MFFRLIYIASNFAGNYIPKLSPIHVNPSFKPDFYCDERKTKFEIGKLCFGEFLNSGLFFDQTSRD